MSSSVLKTQHTSLQFSDSPREQEHDVRQLFARGKQFPIKTGTESGTDNALHGLLRRYAKENNHRIHFARGNWVAVDKSIIKPGSVKVARRFVLSNDKVVGNGHDLVFPIFTFTHIDPRIGRIAQAAVHYPKNGRRPGDPNYEANERYSQKIHDWMEQASCFGALTFVNGDFNMFDNKLDWAFKQGWTSMGDELKKWPNTGHGPIDGAASFDKNRRVKAKRLVVLNDDQMKMYSDHFVFRGTWDIRHLKGVTK